MCGIAGIIIKQRTSLNLPELATSISKLLKHRGPDGEGLLAISQSTQIPLRTEDTPGFTRQDLRHLPAANSHCPENVNAILAHRRLAIIDLNDSGHQPMCDPMAKAWITYNGELYNYKELRTELIHYGFSFVTESDTEVILNAYLKWGQECVLHFNGMWSFCIYDTEKRIYFASRDRLGVKPFYYLNTAEYFAFASEQKALVKSGLIKAEFSYEQLSPYLFSNELEYSKSNFFKDIIELWPGENLVLDTKENTCKTYTYFSTKDLLNTKLSDTSEKELIELVEHAVINAVNLRMRSDVPVGTCLSGGIDSSIIACTMAQLSNDPIRCFTSVFTNGAVNEEPFANAVAQHIHGRHYKTTPNVEEFHKDIDTLVYALDTPIWDSSTYAQFRVMKLAKENNTKVVLDGQGADELFAGYHHHFLAYWMQLKNEDGLIKFFSEVHNGKKSIPHPFLFLTKQWLKPLVSKANSELLNLEHPSSVPITFETLNEQLIDDLGPKRLKSFLRCEDRCGMWHSVESRTPFSDDIDLIRLAFSINGKQKIKNGVSKHLLREAFSKQLPEKIYQRYDKVGFETPLTNWMDTLKPEIISSIKNAKFDFVVNTKVEKAFASADLNTYRLLFKLYILSRWQLVFAS